MVDLGPDGGEGGGRILFAGTPEQLAASDTATGRYLAEELARFTADDDDDAELDLEALVSDEEDEEEEDVVEEEDETSGS